MRKLLTHRLAEKAKPQAKPYQIHDTAIPGLVLRVQPTGTKVWKLIQRKKPRTLGQMPVTTFGMAKAQAERILRGEEHGPSIRFDNFLKDYYQDYVGANHSQPDASIRCLQRFGLGDVLLDQINLADIEIWRLKKQKDGTKASTINRNTATLRAALNKAIDWDLLDQHPMIKMKPLKVDRRKKPRNLSLDEESRLYAALEARDKKKHRERQSANEWRKERQYELLPLLDRYTDNLNPQVRLAINTGLRRGELWNLQWSDIDLKERMLTVHGKGAKSCQTRHVPLNPAALEALKIHRGAAVPLPHKPVFGRAEFKTAWKAVLNDAGITSFRFHDLRHTFASKLVIAGVPLNTVRELMGHASLDMTLVYAHMAPDNLRDAVDLISGGASHE